MDLINKLIFTSNLLGEILLSKLHVINDLSRQHFHFLPYITICFQNGFLSFSYGFICFQIGKSIDEKTLTVFNIYRMFQGEKDVKNHTQALNTNINRILMIICDIKVRLQIPFI